MMSNQYQLHNIKFAYDDKIVLDIEQQSFEQGKITALVGANGSGKSSLLGLMAFILQPGSGEIMFAGENNTKRRITILRKSVGLVQQNPYLIKGSVNKNIELGLKFHRVNAFERKRKVENMLQLLKIEHLADRSVKSLSGGEAQKVAIGRTLVLEPQVILLDEPFTYLDRKFIAEFESLIKDLRDQQNKTIVFTTHNKSQAETLSDHVYRLIDGCLTVA